MRVRAKAANEARRACRKEAWRALYRALRLYFISQNRNEIKWY